MSWGIQPRSKSDAASGGLAWITRGGGAPLLLIHGVGLRAEAWGGQFEEIGASYDIRAVDLPGHGQSAAFGGDPAIADFAALLAELLERKGPSFVAGHSIGALIALELAARYPASCRAVAALSAIYRRSPAAAQAVRARADALSTTRVSDPSCTLERWFPEDADCAEARACRDWLTGVEPRAYKDAYRAFAAADGPSDAALAAISCPVLFMTGEADPNSTPAMSEAMAALAPRGEALIVKGAAHMLPMTHAAQVNRALLDFFGSCSGAAP